MGNSGILFNFLINFTEFKKKCGCGLQSDQDSNTSGRNNPTESLIEREIRLQKEREEALANERQQALLLANHKKLPASTGIRKPEATLAPQLTTPATTEVSSAELRISEEIRELKRREEELRRIREASTGRIDAEGMDSDQMPSMSTSGDEGLYSDADAHSDERDVSEPNSR